MRTIHVSSLLVAVVAVTACAATPRQPPATAPRIVALSSHRFMGSIYVDDRAPTNPSWRAVDPGPVPPSLGDGPTTADARDGDLTGMTAMPPAPRRVFVPGCGVQQLVFTGMAFRWSAPTATTAWQLAAHACPAGMLAFESVGSGHDVQVSVIPAGPYRVSDISELVATELGAPPPPEVAPEPDRVFVYHIGHQVLVAAWRGDQRRWFQVEGGSYRALNHDLAEHDEDGRQRPLAACVDGRTYVVGVLANDRFTAIDVGGC